MLLNMLLIIIKKKIVDIVLINKYIKKGIKFDKALYMYNDVVGHNSNGRLKLTEREFKEVWEYLNI